MFFVVFVDTVAHAQIESVSGFRQCVEFTDPDTGQQFDCTSGIATAVRMRIATSQNGVDTRSFSARLTVVPNEDSDTGAQPTGTDCVSPNTDTCIPTTPADIEIDVGPGVYVYRLEPVEQGTQDAAVPYVHYTSPSTVPLYTDDPGLTSDTIEPLLDLDDAVCVQVGVTSMSSSTLSKNIDFASSFFSDVNNQAHFRCNNTYTAAPRLDENTATEGSITHGSGDGAPKGTMIRTYACTHTCLAGSGTCHTTVQMSVQFLPLGDTYRAYRILNPPLLAAPVNVTLRAAPVSVDSPPTVETLSVRTITTNGQASLGVTSPGGSVAVQILGTDTANGKTGPYLPGLVIAGTTGGQLLDMNKDLPGIYSDPWNNRPTGTTAQCTLNDSVQGTSVTYPYPDRVALSPCSLAFLTNDDPMATVIYVNSSRSITVGDQCQQTSPRDDTYLNLPPNAVFTSASQPAVPLASICQETQCSDADNCGTGLYTTDVLCTPGFGLGLGGEEVFTPCDYIAQKSAFELDPHDVNGGIQFAPGMPRIFDPQNPNMWIGKDNGEGQYYLAYNQETRPIELDLLLTIGGGSVSYTNPVPNGGFAVASVACVVGAGRVGQALYRVCNSDASGLPPANYEIVVSCGLESQFNPVTQSFAVPSGAAVTPGQQFLSDVPANTCATIGYGADEETGNPGARPFLIEITDPDEVFTTDDEDQEPFVCAYQLRSNDSPEPGAVVLSRALAQCRREDASPGDPPAGFDPDYIYYLDPTATNPINKTELDNRAEGRYQDYLDEQDDPSVNAKAITWSLIIGAAVFVALLIIVGTVLFCAQWVAAERLDKKRNM